MWGDLGGPCLSHTSLFWAVLSFPRGWGQGEEPVCVWEEDLCSELPLLLSPAISICGCSFGGVGRKNNFPSTLLSSCSWTNDEMDMKQINREKNDQIDYICTHRGSLRTHWTEEMEAGVWDFKRQVGNSQVDEEEQTCGKQMFAGPSGPRRGLCRLLPVPHLVQIVLGDSPLPVGRFSTQFL